MIIRGICNRKMKLELNVGTKHIDSLNINNETYNRYLGTKKISINNQNIKNRKYKRYVCNVRQCTEDVMFIRLTCNTSK